MPDEEAVGTVEVEETDAPEPEETEEGLGVDAPEEEESEEGAEDTSTDADAAQDEPDEDVADDVSLNAQQRMDDMTRTIYDLRREVLEAKQGAGTGSGPKNWPGGYSDEEIQSAITEQGTAYPQQAAQGYQELARRAARTETKSILQEDQKRQALQTSLALANSEVGDDFGDIFDTESPLRKMADRLADSDPAFDIKNPAALALKVHQANARLKAAKGTKAKGRQTARVRGKQAGKEGASRSSKGARQTAGSASANARLAKLEQAAAGKGLQSAEALALEKELMRRRKTGT